MDGPAGMVDATALGPSLRAVFEERQAALEALRAEHVAPSGQSRRLKHLLR